MKNFESVMGQVSRKIWKIWKSVSDKSCM